MTLTKIHSEQVAAERPCNNTDNTPNESVMGQFGTLRQLSVVGLQHGHGFQRFMGQQRTASANNSEGSISVAMTGEN